MDRRRFLQAGAAFLAAPALADLLAACSQPSDSQLSFWNWQDYIDPKVLDDFQDRTGIAVTYSTYASNDELEQRLNLAGAVRKGGRKPTSVDLIVPSDNLFASLQDNGRLQPLDRSVVTPALLANLDPELRAAQPDPGDRYSVPWATGTTGIGYDTRVFDEPPTWEVFRDPSHAGKTTLLDEEREAFAAALFSLGEDPNTTDPDTIDAAAVQLGAMAEVIDGFDSATYLDRLRSGELVAAQGFNTDVLQARRSNRHLAFTIPEAGGTRWTDLLCIPSDAPSAANANRFVAFVLEPEISARIAEASQVDTGNRAARRSVSPRLLEDPAVFPPAAIERRLVTLEPLPKAAAARYATAWRRINR